MKAPKIFIQSALCIAVGTRDTMARESFADLRPAAKFDHSQIW
jgi:hypothetical protein